MTDKEPRLFELLPHRPPMLLLDKVVAVSARHARSQVTITPQAPFFVSHEGVPTWVALEYMGQTAALIAGYQLQNGIVEPHVGLLLGTRKFSATVPWLRENQTLDVSCEELAVVGVALATFDCKVCDAADDTTLVGCKLSVYRKPVDDE